MCWCGSMAEQLICNQQVDGSTPFTSSIYGSVPERPKGADCKSVVTDFGGPNPPAPTNKKGTSQEVPFLLVGQDGKRSPNARVATLHPLHMPHFPRMPTRSVGVWSRIHPLSIRSLFTTFPIYATI